MQNLESYIENLSCVILFCNNENKITQIEDIFKIHKIIYKKIESLDNAEFSTDKFYIINGSLRDSFKINDIGVSFINIKDIIKDKVKQHSNKRNPKSNFFIDQLKNLEIGSPVVHEIHGIGRYDGLKHLKSAGISNEYLTILYEDNDKLYVPVSSLHLVI